MVAMIWCVAALAAGCARGDQGEGQAGGRLSVAAGMYPLAEMAMRIGGDEVRVVNLTPVGAEAHDAELTTDQVDEVEDADLVLYVGAGFQPAIAAASRRAGERAIDVLEHLEGVNRLGDSGPVDPHFWLDPSLLAATVDRVKEEMVSQRPSHRDVFAANASRYKAELVELDTVFSTRLQDCERRTVVTAHDAFGYLGTRYRLDMRAIAGLEPESEPNPRRIAALTDEIKEAGVTTVFYESLAPPDIAQALAREAGVKTAVLNPVEGLTKAEKRAGKTYAALMRENLAALVSALGCR